LQKELDALTYRVLAYLLLGVVRIYSKKVDFLFDDCNKALIGVKEFVAKERNREKTGVSLPASIECFSIALPERFELDAFDLGVLEDFHGYACYFYIECISQRFFHSLNSFVSSFSGEMLSRMKILHLKVSYH